MFNLFVLISPHDRLKKQNKFLQQNLKLISSTFTRTHLLDATTFSRMTLCIMGIQHFNIVLICCVIIQSVVMLNVFIPNVIVLSAILLSAIMMSVIMLSVMLGVSID
jgi:hypothetical protein